MTALYSLLTIQDIAFMWGKHENTVRNALGARRNPLVFRQASRCYLITYESCERRWGKPKNPPLLLN